MHRPSRPLSSGLRQRVTALAPHAAPRRTLRLRKGRAALPTQPRAWAPRGRGGLTAAAARVAPLGTSDNRRLSDVADGHGPCSLGDHFSSEKALLEAPRSRFRAELEQGPCPPASLAPLDITGVLCLLAPPLAPLGPPPRGPLLPGSFAPARQRARSRGVTARAKAAARRPVFLDGTRRATPGWPS